MMKTPTNNKHDNDDNVAIDFLQLMREEKRRARDALRKKSKKTTAAAAARSNSDSTNTTGIVNIESSSETTMMRQTNAIKRHSIPIWDHTNGRLWLSATSPQLNQAQHRVSPSIDTIHYIPEFLSEPHQSNLLEWLQRLPENNELTNSTTNKTPEEGCWNRMRYGKRRVALFSSMNVNDSNENAEDAVRLPSQVKHLCESLVDNGGVFDQKTTSQQTSSKDNDTTLSTTIPLPLQDLCDALVETGIFASKYKPNHILVNEYQPGQGILPHTDGPVYYPTTATLSIGQSSVLLNFRPRLATHNIGTIVNNENTTINDADDDATDTATLPTSPQVLLEGNGSLVVFADDAYTKYTHDIQDNIRNELVSDQCVNAAAGTFVERGYRISLTFRHKLQLSAS